MSTIERQIDALGGTSGNPIYDAAYSDALTEAMKIGADADALVEELLETLEHVLQGAKLKEWSAYAELTVHRARARRAA